VLAFAAGIAAIFDLTGTTVYRTMRPVLPPSPAPDEEQDPFLAAMTTIMTAHRDVAGRARAESGIPGHHG
jgi:hypothetical protein